MRNELIKLNSDREYQEIKQFLKELGKPVSGHLQYTDTWSIMEFNQIRWELTNKERLKQPFNLISYSDFINKYSKEKDLFYIKYCEGFTEDIFNAFIKYCTEKYGVYNRSSVELSYSDFKERYNYLWVEPEGISCNESLVYWSQDNNSQDIDEQITISELKTLINYVEPATTGLDKYKVYIKGNKARGEEVIQKLIELGGKNIYNLGGWGNSYYYIDKNNFIVDKGSLDLTDRTELFLDEPVNEPINKIEIFPGIYVGNVVVSLGTRKCRKIGDIFKVLIESKKGHLDYKTGFSSNDSHEWRLATPEEKEAFEKGITNINDIKNEPEEAFSKFIGQWVTYHLWSTKSVCKVTKIEKYSFDRYSYYIHFDKGYVNFKTQFPAQWSTNVKELKILSKEELKDYLPEDVYNKEFPETVKPTSLQDYLKSIPDTFTDQLVKFPREIVQKMVERQVDQGNKPDYIVFEKSKTATKYNRGFDWNHSKEGYSFWSDIVFNHNVDVFYEKYPKTETETEVTLTNVYNVERDIYGILTSDSKIVKFDINNNKLIKHVDPIVKGVWIEDEPKTNVSYEMKYDPFETENPCYEIPPKNKPNTFDHLPFVQVKELPIF